MSLNDSLASALSKIQNAERVGKDAVEIKPVSKVVKHVLTILNDQKYVGVFEENETTRGNQIKLNLLHNINKIGAIKPRFAFKSTEYEKVEKQYLPAKDFGLIIVTTSKGIMTLEEAKKQKIGGKLVAYCY